jgi:D-alanyl-D-alanine carboxypeptidase
MQKAINHFKTLSPSVQILIGILSGLVILGVYQYVVLSSELKQTSDELALTKTELEASEAAFLQANNENHELNDALAAEKNRNDEFEDRIEKLSGTVKTLDKLTRTDPELLKKYSKISFLNENYLPERLTKIDAEYLAANTQNTLFLAKAWSFLEDMLQEADEDDIELRVVSAYRSFGTQAALKSGYNVIYGAGTANQFSAEQGYSEHQLGTAVDLSTLARGSALDGFEADPAYVWLQKNAHKFGFILSYPKGNTYYQFEPWHWRFVGKELATDLYSDKKYFYDLDQREIDEYLIKIFDK